MIASIVGIDFFRDHPGTHGSVEQKLSVEKEQGVEKRNEQAVETGIKKKESFSEKLSLQVTALEDTWLKVIIDDKESNEYSLKSGDRIELEAGSGYNLLIGNAAGLEILLNDTPVSVPGKRGQVVTIHLP